MPLIPCLDCGTPCRHSRCETCGAARALRISRERETHRPSREQRGYDSAWRKMRLAILDRDDWTCAECGKKLSGADATVDHIVPLEAGGSRLEPSNLRALCRTHNSRKRDR